MIFGAFLRSTKAVTKRHVKQCILETHPIHLMNIIQDVDLYSKFLPLCTHSKIIRWKNRGSEQQQQQQLQQQQLSDNDRNDTIKKLNGDIKNFEATLTVGLPPLLQETYVSDVIVDFQKLTVTATSVQSKLFDSLSSKWQLQYNYTPPLEANNHQPQMQEHNDKSYNNNDNVISNDSIGNNVRIRTNVYFEVAITASDPFIIGTLDHILYDVAEQQVSAFNKRCQQIPFVGTSEL